MTFLAFIAVRITDKKFRFSSIDADIFLDMNYYKSIS